MEEIQSQSDKKNFKTPLLITLTILVLLLAGGTYFWYTSMVKSSEYFFNIIDKYDDSAELMQENWMEVVSKSKTALHFLMVLKRLDEWDLREAYKTTLVRALWKFPSIDSFLALAVEYYITYSDGEIFEEHLKNVDVLWNKYPNLLRLYYITVYEDKLSTMEDDEILSLYYRATDGTISWQSLNTLWQLTDNPVFLYLATVKAATEEDIIAARSLYNSFPLEWRSIYSDYYERMAWLLQDINFLLPIIQSADDISSYVKLAAIYVSQQDAREALTVLTDFMDSNPKQVVPHTDYLYFYMWLETAINGVQNLTRIEPYIVENGDEELIVTYLTYMYTHDSDAMKRISDDNSTRMADAVTHNAVLLFLQKLVDNDSIEQNTAFLWNHLTTLTDSAEIEKWTEISAVYFLQNNLLYDYDELREQYGMYEAALVPYQLYFYAKFFDHIAENTIQQIMTWTNNTDYGWWHYYNVAVYMRSLGQYEQAKFYLNLALEHLNTYLENTDYKEYVYAQYTNLYLLEENLESASQYLQQLQTFFPTSVFISDLRIQYDALLQENN